MEQEVTLAEALEGPVERAQARADTVRSLLTATWLVLADAWEAKDHETLGYGSWSEYMTGEYGDLRLNLCADDRAEAVMWLLGAGMTQGQVGETLGVSQSTVSRARKVANVAMHMHNLVPIVIGPDDFPCRNAAQSDDERESSDIGTDESTESEDDAKNSNVDTGAESTVDRFCPTCHQDRYPAHEDTWDGFVAALNDKVATRLHDAADTASHVLAPDVAMHFERIRKSAGDMRSGVDGGADFRTIMDAVTELATTLVSKERTMQTV